MTPLPLANPTRCFVSPTDWDRHKRGECADIDIVDLKDGDLNIMYSAWKPSVDDLLTLINGGHIWLGVIGTTHPVISLHVGEAVDEKAE